MNSYFLLFNYQLRHWTAYKSGRLRSFWIAFIIWYSRIQYLFVSSWYHNSLLNTECRCLTNKSYSEPYKCGVRDFGFKMHCQSFRYKLCWLESHLLSRCFIIIRTSLRSVFLTRRNQLPEEGYILVPFLQNSRAFGAASFFLYHIKSKSKLSIGRWEFKGP